MAYKSLFLSIALTAFIVYAFTIFIINPNSLLKNLTDLRTLPIFIMVFLLYLLYAWWAFKGFGEHKPAALLSLGLCAFGLGLFVIGYKMEAGRGKAAPEQYDYDFSKLHETEKSALETMVSQ